MSERGLPEGWTSSSIAEVSVKGEQRKPSPGEQFIYVDIGSIDRESKTISSPQVLAGEDAPSRARKVICTGDVLVSLTRPNLNAVALVDENHDGQIASTGFEVIRPQGVVSHYLFSLVQSRAFINAISGKVQGALYPAAKSTDVKAFRFPLPPLDEQKIISDKLDMLLAQVNNLKARLDAMPAILKRFRQSVLAAAVSGKLTENWRSGQGWRATGFSESWKWEKVPTEWDEALFGEVVDSRLGKMLDRSKNTGNETAYIGNVNVRWFDFNLDDL